MTDTSTYPLRLPKSIKAAAEQLAKAEGLRDTRMQRWSASCA